MSGIQLPRGIYNSIKDWASAVNSPKVYLKEIYPPTTFSRRIRRPPTQYPKVLEGGNVGIIPNGRVWGLNGAIITPDNHLIWDVSLEMVHPRTKHSIFEKEMLPPITDYYEQVADLTHVVANNYYHWMYEVIPRVHLLHQSGIDVDRFIVKSQQVDLPFQSETLNQLGIKEHQFIWTDCHFHIQSKNLVVPSQPSFATKWGYEFLRKTFLTGEAPTNKVGKRIYISRKWARRITNEDALMDVLSKFGFVKVELETLSVAEQAQLFSSAEIIVAAHGAGLVNLTFCQPGTKVIEIFSPTYITSLYWVISSLGNLMHYYFIGGLGERDDIQLENNWVGLDNITVNISKFKAFLRGLRI
ncbi:glycosyltransferase family 61 protein [Bacillus sp. 1P10SD]|uniref:glycosyltransferase family 61 protein n=1 Tax=Bacillus sp. 1P10SD TaxID=3132265 RepID=UPI0039A6003E